MRSTKSGTPEDLTARARIRDAAIRRFATDGMGAPLRAVAADAGVSPGLILHHFGSRAGLRAACDEHVLAEIRESKTAVLNPTGGTGAFLAQLAGVEGYAPLVGYVLRCLQAGGQLASDLVDHLASDAVGYFAQAVEAGTMRPSRDPEGRARLLTEQALGALLLQLPARQEHLDLETLPAWLHGYLNRIALPMLELLTEPLLTDATLLEAYLASRTD
ncbi:TetR/AcrR family transcriptional regulator [Georgenia thermotolerans]|uniref:TetR family transcriptional regulator n=1 Tax=Georgenia thermotolerans TaxID=527326 RepID=A0A7J5USG1_9MICO|nr:TetR family transcriptional regulator [Georgenia thermotolerans]KAE8765094.1 TetR family transcriptional regulator [Georgenia thermotolerans]